MKTVQEILDPLRQSTHFIFKQAVEVRNTVRSNEWLEPISKILTQSRQDSKARLFLPKNLFFAASREILFLFKVFLRWFLRTNGGSDA
jgi:hypothetical protein